MNFTRKTVLFFLAHGKLTAETNAEARTIEAKHNVNIRFRNGTVGGNCAPEKADYVAGGPIPHEYANYPRITIDGPVAVPVPESVETVQAETPAPSTLAQEVGTVNNGGWT